MSFTDGKPRIATEAETKLHWCSHGPGEFFRCGFCGHKFKVGDQWRFCYTNDIPGSGGNPLVCAKCDGPDEEVRARWKAKCEEWLSAKWWWFRRR